MKRPFVTLKYLKKLQPDCVLVIVDFRLGSH